MSSVVIWKVETQGLIRNLKYESNDAYAVSEAVSKDDLETHLPYFQVRSSEADA